MSEWWITIALVGSGMLNVILLLLLFLKLALNEIVTHWFKWWRARKEEKRRILLELNERMHTFDTNYFMSNMWMLTQHNAASPADKAAAAARVAEFGAKTGDTLQFFARHDLEFPAVIRTLIGDLRNAMVAKDIDLVFDGKEILSRTTAVTRTVNRIRRQVGELVA